MTASLHQELEQIGALLNINKKDYSVKSLLSNSSFIATALKLAEKCQLYQSLEGCNKESKALVFQWLESRLETTDDSLPLLVNKLNEHLLSCVYIVQDQLTIIDFVMFSAFRSYLLSLSQMEKQTNYCNVSRWLAFIQSHITKSRKNELAIVMKNNYYN